MKPSRRSSRHTLAVLLLGATLVTGGAACDSGKGQTGNGGMTGAAGGANGLGGANGAGAGGAGGPGGAGGAIALVDWVTDLTDNHTNDVSPPDTVTDKNIIDTEDPAAFAPLLARP